MENLYKTYGKSNNNVKYKVGSFLKWWITDIKTLNPNESVLQHISNKLDNISESFMSRDVAGNIHVLDDIIDDQ